MGQKRAKKQERRADWRAFEALVARIERLYSPRSATVKLDDKIPELVTGNLRQVDASIRYVLGSTPILVIVECQKRGRAADKTWFEQLKTKKEELGASSVLAVTHKAVGPHARDAARRYGIEVRCLHELQDDKVRPIETGVPGVTVRITDVRAALDSDTGRPTSLSVGFADKEPSIQIDPGLMQRLRADPMHTPFLFDASGGHGRTVESIINEARDQGWDPTGGAPVGQEHESTLSVGLQGEWYSPTPLGLKQVVGVEVGYRTTRGLGRAALALHAYDGATRFVQVADGAVPAPDGRSEFRITLGLDERGLRAGVEQVRLDMPDGPQT